MKKGLCALAAAMIIAGQADAAEISPTTGRMIPHEAVMPITVVVSVNPNVQPCGLQYADVIYESYLSESSTRMLAVFHDALSQKEIVVGPARSVQETHLSISREWGAGLVYGSSTGGNTRGAPSLRSFELPHFGLTNRQQYRVKMQRSKGRKVKAPDVFAADVSAVCEAYHRPFAAEGWHFGTWDGGESAQEVRVSFGAKREVSFQYENGAYRSSLWTYLGGEGTEGQELRFANVIVQETEYTCLNGNEWLSVARLTGEGRAWVYRDGRVTQVRWVREAEEDSTRFFDENGGEIPLAEGCTYVAHVRKK